MDINTIYFSEKRIYTRFLNLKKIISLKYFKDIFSSNFSVPQIKRVFMRKDEMEKTILTYIFMDENLSKEIMNILYETIFINMNKSDILDIMSNKDNKRFLPIASLLANPNLTYSMLEDFLEFLKSKGFTEEDFFNILYFHHCSFDGIYSNPKYSIEDEEYFFGILTLFLNIFPKNGNNFKLLFKSCIYEGFEEKINSYYDSFDFLIK